MEGYTRSLARFCSCLDYAALPSRVVEKTKWIILDSLGNILGAATLAFGETMAAFAQSLRDHEEATLLKFGTKSSARNAALVNGSLAETVELQDGYTRGGYHPCCGTIGASLAVAEWQNKAGRDLITAVVAGYEVGDRVAEAIHPTHLARGFQPTGTVGTIGAAAAAARLLGMDEDRAYEALSIAAFILPVCTGDNLWGGYSVKPVHGGAAAKSGIEAVLLAQRGLRAAPLEGDPKIGKGFCRIVSDDPPRFEKTLEGLGEEYTVEQIYFKPYATCRINQAPIEIALDLRNRYGLKVQDITSVLIKTYDYASKRTGAMRTDPSSPFTQVQFSMSYAVACALIDGEVGLRQLTEQRIRDPEVHRFASKIRVIADAEMQRVYPAKRPAILEITTEDGRTLTGRRDFAKGDHRNPMTERELTTKFLDLARPAIGDPKAKRAMAMVMDLEHLDSLDSLMANLIEIGGDRP